MKITRFAPFVALALAACQQPQETAPEGNPDARPGVTLRGGTLYLPPVAGNPGAAYFTLTNSGAETSLAAVAIEGVDKAEMHETRDGKMARLDSVPLPTGAAVTFERGAKHVMAFGIGDVLKPGATTEITLTFADGDKLSAPLDVKSMADAMGDAH